MTFRGPIIRSDDAPRRHLDERHPTADDGLLPARVLIVDDATVFREVACELLERRGYAVVGAAGSAAAAKELVGRLELDAVLLDVRLPDGDGFALAAELTASVPGLAVVLMSADRAAPDPERVRACGARGFVLKSQLAAADLAQFWPEP